MLYFKNNNQQGYLLLKVVMVSALVSIIGMYIVGVQEQKRKLQVKETLIVEAKYSLQAVTSLFTYFISENLVVCRDLDKEGKWSNGNNTDCIWASDLPGVKPEDSIPLSKYNLSMAKSDGELSFVFASNYPFFSSKKLEVKTFLKIVDLQEDEQLLNIMGGIPEDLRTPRLLDDDYKVIRIRSEVYLKDTKRIILYKQNFVRRPIATPEMSVVGSGSCLLGCARGINLSDSPGCRGVFESGEDEKVGLQLKIRNLGPGVLYGIRYKKTMTFNKDIYPGLKVDDGSVDPLTPLGKDILFPGEEVVFQDEAKCFKPVRVSNTTSIHQNGGVSINYLIDLADKKNSNVIPRRLFREIPVSSNFLTPILLIPPH